MNEFKLKPIEKSSKKMISLFFLLISILWSFSVLQIQIPNASVTINSILRISIFFIIAWTLWFANKRIRRYSFEFKENQFIFTTTFYQRKLTLDQIDINKIAVIRLEERTEYKPYFKKNGVGLPNLKSGWYYLKNRENALVYRTIGEKLLYIPTTLKYCLLIEFDSPELALKKMQEIIHSNIPH